MQDWGSSKNNHGPCHCHDLIEKSGIAQQFELPFTRNIDESIQQRQPRNTVLVKRQITVVNSVVAKLGSNITYLNIWERHVVLTWSDGHHKWLYSIWLSINLHVRHHNSMSRNSTKWSWPEFDCTDRGSMNDELISSFIKSSCSFKAGDITTMTKLSLCVAAQKLQVINERHPSVFLLLWSQEVDGLGEHGLVQVNDGDALEHVWPAERERLASVVLSEVDVVESWVIVGGKNNLPPLGMLLFPRHVEEVDIRLQVGIQIDFLINYFHLLKCLLGDDELS